MRLYRFIFTIKLDILPCVFLNKNTRLKVLATLSLAIWSFFASFAYADSIYSYIENEDGTKQIYNSSTGATFNIPEYEAIYTIVDASDGNSNSISVISYQKDADGNYVFENGKLVEEEQVISLALTLQRNNFAR